MTQTHREVERKLRVHALFRLPSLAGAVPGVASVETLTPFTMRNTYFDTDDLRLFRWGVTLRRREGSGDEGWHLKLPVDGADGSHRDEIRAPLDEGDVPPAELTDLVTALLRGAPVRSVATLRTERAPHHLLDPDGNVVAEVVDDTVTVLDDNRTVGVFREVEVEAVTDEGDEADLDLLGNVVDSLVEYGAVPHSLSKAAAALGPRTQQPPDVPEPRWPHRHDPAEDAVRAFLATHVRRLLLQDIRLRRDLPDAVHQMRVAARRLRSGLQVFRPLVDRPWADRLRTELAWAAGSLGAARDTEVLQERLDRDAAGLADEDARLARSVIDPALEERMRRSRNDAEELLGSERYRSLLDDLVVAVHDPRLTSMADETCDEALPPLVAKAFRRLDRDVRALTLDSPSAQWHETRIAAKRARYATDAIAPVFGKRVETLSRELARVTDILGQHQDAYVAQATLAELAPDADPRAAFALGLLHGLEQRSEMRDREEFLALWPAARRAARRSGLV